MQRGVSSVEVAGSILQGLKTSERALTLQELARVTGLEAPRLHHYLVSLVRIGLVQKDPTIGRYALGSFAMELGLVAADNLDLQHASGPWLRRLSSETGESSFFAVGSPRGALIVRWEQGTRPLTVHARLGTVMPILRSATGLVWLAFDVEGSAEALEAELRRIDPIRRLSARKIILSEAADVRRYALAQAHGSLIPNVNAFACPVFRKHGGFAGVLSVLGLGGPFNAEPKGRTARRLISVAAEFGRHLS